MARNSIAPGGYIGGEPPRRPTFNQLSGVWKLDDVLERQKNNQWTNVLGVEDVFSTYLYTGNGSTQTITNGIDLSGKGGLVWVKARSNVEGNILTDTARGSFELSSNATNAAFGGGTTFGSTGFSVNYLTSSYGLNTNNYTYASWTFRKAAKFFDVVTYTGNGSNRTIAHALGSVPGCIIVKRTDTASDWQVYHRSLLSTEYLVLNSTAAKAIGATRWNSTTPTSTEFSLGTDATVNANNGTYVAYLFAHDAGGFGDSGNESVIKCGSYVGNGSASGPVIDLGWEPQWVLVKSSTLTTGAPYWSILDNMRGSLSLSSQGNDLYANFSTSENTGGAPVLVANATGFSLVSSNDRVNANGQTYIYIAIRRGPMKAPTDATKVFSANFGTSSLTVPTFQTGFPVDLGLFRNGRNTTVPILAASRLTGSYLETASTSIETANPAAFTTASNTGWGTTYDSTRITWNFRRAPGFFDVVAYTGTGTFGTAISHNLGVAPEMIILKSRSATSTRWPVYQKFFPTTGGNQPEYGTMFLNTNDGWASSGFAWANTIPTSTQFSVGFTNEANASGATYIAYLFASCPGVSKVGSYTGTGTTLDIDCGFANGARFVLIKRADSTGDWFVWDNARGVVSGNDPYLLLNSTAAEVTNTDYIDPLSSGFQISSTAPASINANGGSFIYLAIA